MSITVFGLLIVGLAGLILGAELLVRGASRLAATFGIPSIIIGLTVVSLSTSAPEVVVTASSALSGVADLAIGNVVGSNISNILLILGLSSVIAPLVVHQRLIRLDIPILIFLSMATYLMAMNGLITRWEGLLLLAGLVLYLVFTVLQGRNESEAVRAEYEQEYGQGIPRQAKRGIPLNLALTAGGIVFLLLGASWFVDGAEQLARQFGISELVIGLTVVSVGTSLPEIVTSVMASLRGERDIAVGNVIGSCIYNILFVLGIAALIARPGVPVAPAALRFDIPVMLAAAVACLPIFFIGNQISRWEGFLFLGYYAAYVAYLLLASTQHDALPIFSSVMLRFVIPLTVITVLIFVFREVQHIRRRKQAAAPAG